MQCKTIKNRSAGVSKRKRTRKEVSTGGAGALPEGTQPVEKCGGWAASPRGDQQISLGQRTRVDRQWRSPGPNRIVARKRPAPQGMDSNQAGASRTILGGQKGEGSSNRSDTPSFSQHPGLLEGGGKLLVGKKTGGRTDVPLHTKEERDDVDQKIQLTRKTRLPGGLPPGEGTKKEDQTFN